MSSPLPQTPPSWRSLLDCGAPSPLSPAGLVPRRTPQAPTLRQTPRPAHLSCLLAAAFLTLSANQHLSAQAQQPPPTPATSSGAQPQSSTPTPTSQAPTPSPSPAPPGTPAPEATPEPPPPSPPVDQILTKPPRVWIFNGLPGDEENHAFDEANLASIKKSLTTRFGLPADRITILYGPKSTGYDGVCTAESLHAELTKITALTKARSASASDLEANGAPVWIIFHGHSNSIPGGAMFNIPGPDLSARDIAEALAGAGTATAPLVIVATTDASDAFLKALAGPHRIILSATTEGDKDNGTYFPQAFAEALAAPASDTNRDGILTLTELFTATSAGVHRIYNASQFMLKEHAQLDGDGDGKGTQRPAAIDAKPASAIGLKITETTQKFD